MNALPSRRVLLSLLAPAREAVLAPCAQALVSAYRAELITVCERPAAADAVPAWPPTPEGSLAATWRFCRQAPVDMLLAEWPDDPALLADTLELSTTLRGPTVLVHRPDGLAAARRIVVFTNAGPHSLRPLWLAHELAAHYELPVQVTHIEAEEEAAHGEAESVAALTQVEARLLGLGGEVVLHQAPTVLAGMLATIQPDDLIVLGAPPTWRLGEAKFGATVPAQLAAAVPNPLVMLVAPQVQAVSPREVLWSGNILTHLQAATWEDAIAALIDRLIERQQVPAAWREFLLERARARELRTSTALGCETAFPHILIPDYYGLAVAFAVLPDGVYFTDREVGPVRFICLLIIPESCYGQYLGLIANLARLLVLPAVRAELLQATTPKAVLQLLAPEEEEDEWANETSPGLRIE